MENQQTTTVRSVNEIGSVYRCAQKADELMCLWGQCYWCSDEANASIGDCDVDSYYQGVMDTINWLLGKSDKAPATEADYQDKWWTLGNDSATEAER